MAMTTTSAATQYTSAAVRQGGTSVPIRYQAIARLILSLSALLALAGATSEVMGYHHWARLLVVSGALTAATAGLIAMMINTRR